MKMLKNFVNEIAQVTWINGRQLTVDTTYVIIFTGILLVFFAGVDGGLAELFKRFING